jgi:hypothetical protein
VTTPNEQSELAAVVEFKNQDWVRYIIQATGATTMEKAYADPNVAFPFQENFSVGTIHGANKGTKKHSAGQAVNDMGNKGEIIEILDNTNKDDASGLTSKTKDELVALLVQARREFNKASVGRRVASGSNLPLGSGPAAMPSQPSTDGQESLPANSAISGTGGNCVDGNASSGSGGK